MKWNKNVNAQTVKWEASDAVIQMHLILSGCIYACVFVFFSP